MGWGIPVPKIASRVPPIGSPAASPTTRPPIDPMPIDRRPAWWVHSFVFQDAGRPRGNPVLLVSVNRVPLPAAPLLNQQPNAVRPPSTRVFFFVRVPRPSTSPRCPSPATSPEASPASPPARSDPIRPSRLPCSRPRVPRRFAAVHNISLQRGIDTVCPSVV